MIKICIFISDQSLRESNKYKILDILAYIEDRVVTLYREI